MNCVRPVRRSFRKKKTKEELFDLFQCFQKNSPLVSSALRKTQCSIVFGACTIAAEGRVLKTRNGDTVMNSASVMPNSVLVVYVLLT